MKDNKNEIKGLAKDICIWKQDCGDCNLNENIFCKPKPKYTILFATPLLIAIVPIVIEVLFFSVFDVVLKILSLGGWLGYGFFFLNIWESRMLCNHCPYYANEAQRTLHCPIDRGKLKTGKYNPGPITVFEKIQFLVGAAILIGFPIPFLLLGRLFTSMIFLGIGALTWIVILQFKICTDCVNFGCPLNRVPDSIMNEFMKKNPVIKKAWEEKGYNFD